MTIAFISKSKILSEKRPRAPLNEIFMVNITHNNGEINGICYTETTWDITE